MLAIPSISGAPVEYSTAEPNALAARIALALAGRKPVPAPRRPKYTVELQILQRQLQDWLDRMNADSRFIEVRLHVALRSVVRFDTDDDNAEAEEYTVWISGKEGLHTGSIWTLERRWKALEAKAPGLAAAALHAIAHAGMHSFPFFVPAQAESWASYQYWHGCNDESEVLDEYRSEVGNPKAGAPEEMITRAWFDKALPPAVCRPRAHRANSKTLQRFARRGGEVGEIARRVIKLEAECAASHRHKSAFEFESQDDNGFQAIGYSACLRWNSADPMLRIYDDYVNEAHQCEGVESAYGWFVMDAAADLPKLLAELEHYFRVLRKAERLIPFIATRST